MNLINPFLKIGKILENTIFMACNPHTIKFYKILKNGPKVDTAKKNLPHMLVIQKYDICEYKYAFMIKNRPN